MKYYEISEEVARRGHEMVHMSDYKEGSATAEYRAAVDGCAELVAQQKAKTSSFYHDKLDYLLDRYARRLAEWTNAYNRNCASCPSVLISGGSNFPVRKKQKQNAREDTLWREYNEIEGIKNKILSVGTGPVDPTDPNARQMHQERLERLQATLDRGKAMNAHYRKHKTMKGFPGMTDDQAAKMDADIAGSYSWAQKPFPDYELNSLRGKIKREQDNLAKLDELEQMQQEPAEGIPFEGGRIIQNAEENRLQIVFDDRPDEETRNALKSRGFHWSPKNQVWQRQLTRNAMWDARNILHIPDDPQPKTKPAEEPPEDPQPVAVVSPDYVQMTIA